MAKESGGLVSLLKEVTIVVVAALVISTLVRLFLVQVFSIPSVSMEPTLLIGDRVAVQKVVPFQRGDVVVFRDDLEWLGNPDRFKAPAWREALVFIGVVPDESERYLIKRVIGTEGDHVTCCDASGRVQVNGVALDETAYLNHSGGQQVAPSRVPFDLVVPAGRIFVMGDNRPNSADSRCHLLDATSGAPGESAFPRKDSVVGSTVLTLFPFDRARTFSVPDAFASVPAASGTPPAKPVFAGEPGHC